MTNIIDFVSDFWEWTGCAKRYKDHDISLLPFDPVEYPLLHEMQRQCNALINQPLAAEEADAFLMCMAIDNESECILDECKKRADDDFINKLVSLGVRHPQSEVRWQMAELLRRDIPDRVVYLEALLHDTHPYVRKRAFNSAEETINY